MARMKARPLQHTTKRKLQERGAREGSRSTSGKRIRLQSPAGQTSSSLEKAKKNKGRPRKVQEEDSHLPPELRRAGILAHMQIPEGRRFGPFIGKIVDKRKSPEKLYFFVSQIKDKNKRNLMHFFYAHKNEKDKCSWLSRLQSATSTAKQNIVAYNSPGGVCFEAVKDIAVGEELMVLFDKSFKGSVYPAYVESAPLSFITDDAGEKIAVVPLDKSEVYINPSTEGKEPNKDGNNAGHDKEMADSLKEGNPEVVDDDDEDNSDDDDDEDGSDDVVVIEEYELSDEDDEEGDEDEDEGEEEEEDIDDGNDVDDDDDFIPKGEKKLTKETGASTNNGEISMEKKRGRKPSAQHKRKPHIKEIKILDAESGQDTIKYRCTHITSKRTSKKLPAAGSLLRPESLPKAAQSNDVGKSKGKRYGCWCPIPGAEEAPKKKPAEEPCCCPCCCPCCPVPSCQHCCHHIHHHHHHCCPCCPCCHCCHCCHCCPSCCHCCHCKRSQGPLSTTFLRRPLFLYLITPYPSISGLYDKKARSLLQHGPLRVH